MTTPITTHDDRRTYCPMLGHHLTFAYCRQTSGATPCGRVFDCWRETFDVEAFLTPHLTDQQRARIGGPRPDKAATLVDLIERARRVAREGA
ncbi:MAG: hypothetical protein GX591_14110 [Planctomycetes bacterium]|nr:hypothetical protein [Planctomycetota bacterium]